MRALVALTDDAVRAVRDLVAASPDVSEESGGLRIFTEPSGEGEMRLNLALVPVPDGGDQVVEDEGVRLFLDLEAATYLDDKVIDADVEGGGVRFSIAPQA